MNMHTKLLMHICNKRNVKSYLEIGVRRTKNNFDFIKSRNLKMKIGVDPDINANASCIMTSDDFFQHLHDVQTKQKFDLVFIDGLHHSDQVLKDINNSLSFLEPNGVIMCHDILPASEQYTMKLKDNEVLKPGQIWNGDCWKAFAYYCSKTQYKFFTLDVDYGLGIIDCSNTRDVPLYNVPSIDKLEWKDYVEHKNEWLNIKDKDFAYSIF